MISSCNKVWDQEVVAGKESTKAGYRLQAADEVAQGEADRGRPRRVGGQRVVEGWANGKVTRTREEGL